MSGYPFQKIGGILLFSCISIGIVLCTIILWFFVLHISSLEKTDLILQQEVGNIDAFIKVLAECNIPPSMMKSEITRHIKF